MSAAYDRQEQLGRTLGKRQKSGRRNYWEGQRYLGRPNERGCDVQGRDWNQETCMQ